MNLHKSYGQALALYVVLFALLTYPYWLQHQVVAPYRPYASLGVSRTQEPEHLIENYKFSDFFTDFIPGMSEATDGGRWQSLVTWTNRNELGRPLLHLEGLTTAYLPTRIIAALNGDVLSQFTMLSLGTCFLGGLFILLFCREISLSPIAALLAAGGFAASPAFMYWITFPMFAAATCWAAGILYALTRMAGKLDVGGCAILAFCTYSALMTGYPQSLVWQIYMLVAYVGYLTVKRWQTAGHRAAATYLGCSTIGVLIGGLAALPVYVDLAHAAIESARLKADLAFFTIFLPRLDAWGPVLRGMILGTLPALYGNPSSASYPLPYDEQTFLTPLTICYLLLGLQLRWREVWGWCAAIAVLLAMAFVHPLYGFAVEHLGFNLSRDTPLDHLTLPLTIIFGFFAVWCGLKRPQAGSRRSSLPANR